MSFLTGVLIVCFIKLSVLEENFPKNLSEILEEIIEHSVLESDNIDITSVETKSENGSNTYYIKAKGQSTENAPDKLANDSNIGVEPVKDMYKVTDSRTLDPKAHIEVTKINEDNSTVKIEYAPKSIEYIIEADNSMNEVIKGSEIILERDTKNTIYPDVITNKTILDNLDHTPNQANNIHITNTRKSGNNHNLLNVLKLNENFEKLLAAVNEKKLLYRNIKEPKTESQIEFSNNIIDKSFNKPIIYPPYNFILSSLNPTLPINHLLYQKPYRKIFFIKPSLFPRRINLLNKYKFGSTTVPRIIPKFRKVYSYYPNYIG